jgi:hypothetical protein
MDGAASSSAAQNSCRRLLERNQAIDRKPAKIQGWRNVSYFSGEAFLKLRQSRVCKGVKFAGFCIALDVLFKPFRFEGLRTKR